MENILKKEILKSGGVMVWNRNGMQKKKKQQKTMVSIIIPFNLLTLTLSTYFLSYLIARL